MPDSQQLTVARIFESNNPQPSSAITHVGDRQLKNGPGMHLNKAFYAGGKYVESATSAIAQACGLGPDAAAKRAVLFLDEAPGRLSKLNELCSFQQDFSTNKATVKTNAVSKLSRECRKVLQYACGSQTPETQLVAFQSIVMLATRYLGLRWLFIEHLKSETTPHPSPSDISKLWRKGRETYNDREWDFFLKYAAYCVSAPDEVTVIAETHKPSDLGLVRDSESCCLSNTLVNWIFNTHPATELSRLAVVRYLGGILELRTFWSHKVADNDVYSFVDMLCRVGMHLLEDIAVDSSDAVTVGDLMTFDTEGINMLISAIMNGFRENGLQEHLVPADDTRSADSRDRVVKLIERLQTPRSKALFHEASDCAETLLGKMRGPGHQGQTSGNDIVEVERVNLAEQGTSLVKEGTQNNRAAPNVTITAQDRIVVVMGPHGAGKSTFIEHATQEGEYRIGHGLQAHSSNIRTVRCDHPVDGNPVVFVDTPGFGSYDATKHSEYEILQLIADQIVKVSQEHIPLSAIVYLHSVSNRSILRSPLQDLKTFTNMYNQSGLPHVAIGTTMWRDVREETLAIREAEMKDKAWKDMTDKGYTIQRFGDSHRSAWDIVGQPHELSNNSNVLFASRGIRRSVTKNTFSKSLLTLLQKQERLPNVIVFGRAGAGKSSLINMIAGHEVAKMSYGAGGCTFKSTGYAIDIPDGPAIRLWDTAGLNEGFGGTVDQQKAISNLFDLIHGLDNGVSLFIYVVRPRTTTENTIINYQMFEAFSEGKVPITLVVTGLEEVEDRDAWWEENKAKYTKAGLDIQDHACVVTTKGRRWRGGEYVYEEEYEESTTAVRQMIKRACLPIPWKKERKSWIAAAATKTVGALFRPSAENTENGKILYTGLKANGFSEEEVPKIVKESYPSFVLTVNM